MDLSILIAPISILITIYTALIVIRYVFYKQIIIEAKAALNSLEFTNSRIITNPCKWDSLRKDILILGARALYFGHRKAGKKLLICHSRIPSCKIIHEDRNGDLTESYRTKLQDIFSSNYKKCHKDINTTRPNIRALFWYLRRKAKK